MDMDKKLKALTLFQNAWKSTKLPYNHPDLAFPFMFLGSVFFELNEPLISLRCFLMARNIWEEWLGEDTVDTATSYNNLGVCMF